MHTFHKVSRKMLTKKGQQFQWLTKCLELVVDNERWIQSSSKCCVKLLRFDENRLETVSYPKQTVMKGRYLLNKRSIANDRLNPQGQGDNTDLVKQSLETKHPNHEIIR